MSMIVRCPVCLRQILPMAINQHWVHRDNGLPACQLPDLSDAVFSDAEWNRLPPWLQKYLTDWWPTKNKDRETTMNYESKIHVIKDDDGEVVLGMDFPASEETARRILELPVDDNGRSDFMWVRLNNGGLILGVYPRGDGYFEYQSAVGQDYEAAEHAGEEEQLRRTLMKMAGNACRHHPPHVAANWAIVQNNEIVSRWVTSEGALGDARSDEQVVWSPDPNPCGDEA